MATAIRGTLVRACAAQAARRAVTMRVGAEPRVLALQPAQQQARRFGIFSGIRDTVTQKMTERNEEKQADMYREQVYELAHSDKFDLNSFETQLKKNADAAGLNGWKSMLPGVSEMTAVQQMKAFLKIIESIEPKFREDPRLINGKAKRQISEKSGHSAEEINNLLRNYEQLRALHLWLKKRVERGLRLPDNMQETQEMVRDDPTGFPSKQFRMKQRRY